MHDQSEALDTGCGGGRAVPLPARRQLLDGQATDGNASDPLEDLLPIGSSCLRQGSMIPEGTLLLKQEGVHSFVDCCDACKGYSSGDSTAPSCNVFAHCSDEGGCTVPPGNPGAGDYSAGNCLLYYQQALDTGGATIKAASFVSNQDIAFVTGAPVQIQDDEEVLSNATAGYKLYAYGLLPDGVIDFPCPQLSSDPDQCILFDVTRTEAAAACAEADACYGFQYLPHGAGDDGGDSRAAAVLKGGRLAQNIQYLLYVGNFLSASPSAELYVRDEPLPGVEEWAVAYWLIPQVNMTANVYQPSGCAIEYHTLYRGDVQQTLTAISSAVDCCGACDRDAGCNAWNFCPYPHGCNLTDTTGRVIGSSEGYSCRLLSSEVVRNGKYPVIVKQDPAEQFTSGLPPKVVRVLEATFNSQPRPNAREEGAEGCISQPQYLYTGLIVVDGNEHIHETLEGCCEACRADSSCNVFAWCPFNDNTTLCEHKYRGIDYNPGACRLKHFSTTAISAVPTMFVGEGTVLAEWGVGEKIDWVSGNPINVANRTVPGYVLDRYASFTPPSTADLHDCPDAQPDPDASGNRCRFQLNTPQEAADLCDSTPDCRAFTWLRYGDGLNDDSYQRPVAYLKGAADDAAFTALLGNSSLTRQNPSSAVYVRRSTLGYAAEEEEQQQESGGGGSDLGLILGISLGVVLLGALLLLLVAGLLLRRARRGRRGGDGAPLSVALHEAAVARRKELGLLGEPLPGAKAGDFAGANFSSRASSSDSKPPRSRDSDKELQRGAQREGGAAAASAGGGERGAARPDSDGKVCEEGGGEAVEAGQEYKWEVQPWELSICKNERGGEEVLGQGAYGTVYRAQYMQGMYCAVKELKDGAAEAPGALNEIAILRGIRSPHVVQFLGACRLPDRFLLVTELMEGGTLWRALQRGRVKWEGKGPLIALDVAQGLHFLHSRRIVHLDLKSANVLLDRNSRAKIADVGLAQVLQNTHISALANAPGTFAWAAPELLLGERVGAPADVFSFGVLLWELVTREEPARGQLRPLRKGECSEAVAALVADCRKLQPGERPTMERVVSMLQAEVREVALRKRGSIVATRSNLSQGSSLGGGNGSVRRGPDGVLASTTTGSLSDGRSLPTTDESREVAA